MVAGRELAAKFNCKVTRAYEYRDKNCKYRISNSQYAKGIPVGVNDAIKKKRCLWQFGDQNPYGAKYKTQCIKKDTLRFIYFDGNWDKSCQRPTIQTDYKNGTCFPLKYPGEWKDRYFKMFVDVEQPKKATATTSKKVSDTKFNYGMSNNNNRGQQQIIYQQSSGGDAAGGIIGACIFCCIIGFIVYYFCFKKRENEQVNTIVVHQPSFKQPAQKPELEMTKAPPPQPQQINVTVQQPMPPMMDPMMDPMMYQQQPIDYGMTPGMQPMMQPGMQPMMQPGMQPMMQPSMQMQPGMQPMMQPGMQPMYGQPGMQQPMMAGQTAGMPMQDPNKQQQA